MKMTVKTNFDLGKLDVGEIRQIGLYNSGMAVVDVAAGNAPYVTGTLKKSISIEPKNVAKGQESLRVGPSGVVYAVRREYENKKNPDRKFYMKRAAAVTPAIVEEEFGKAVEIVVASIKK